MIIVGRFLGFVRPLMPFIAGASRMPFRRFFPYDVLAAGAWSITFCTLGFLFWRSIDQLTTYVSRGLFALGTLVVVIAGIVALIHLRRSPEARAKVRDWIDERDDRPRLEHPRPDLAPGLALRPQARRGRRRLQRPLHPGRVTPGNLGLELTTLLALAAVGAFSFFLLGDIVLNEGEPRIDRWADDVAERLNTDMLVERRQGRDRPRLVVGHRRRSPLATAIFALAPAPLDRGRRARRRLADRASRSCTSPRTPTTAPARPRASSTRSTRPSPRATPPTRWRWIACATVLVRAGVGWAVRIAAVTVARGARRGRRRDPRLPARALFDRRPRRNRARGGDLVSHRRLRAVCRTRSYHREVVTDDQKTYVIAGAAAAISLIAWLFARRRARLEVLLARARPARGDAAERLRAGRVRARRSGRRRGCTLVLLRDRL